MTDTFKSYARSLTSPPENGQAIVPGENTLPVVTRALFVGVGGDLAVRMAGGGAVTLANLPSGTLLPIRVDRVLADGTTADRIVGFW